MVTVKVRVGDGEVAMVTVRGDGECVGDGEGGDGDVASVTMKSNHRR